MADDGIRVELRMIVSHDPEQRFDVNGIELVQFRGDVVGGPYPPVVVRFAGQQQAQLYRWAKPGKHMSVIGYLDVKLWTDRGGRSRMALLIEAKDVYPLNPDVIDHSREGVYATAGRVSKDLRAALTKTAQAEQLRKMLDLANAG